MSYRDDREALRARIDALEAEKAAQTEQHATELAALRTRLERGPKRSGGPFLLAAGVAAVLVAVGMAFSLSSTRSTELPPRTELPPANDTRATAPEPTETEVHRWRGVVNVSTGSKAKSGAKCMVTAGVAASPGVGPAVEAVVTLFYCGDEIFVQTTSANALAPRSDTAKAKRIAPGGRHFTLQYRSGPEPVPEIEIDTARGIARVRRPGVFIDVKMEAESDGPLDPKRSTADRAN